MMTITETTLCADVYQPEDDAIASSYCRRSLYIY